MNRRREERKLAAIQQLGGRCLDCGFDDLSRWEVFQFDHLPGTEKLGNLGRMLQKATDLLIQAELKKCELVCANCHQTRTRQRKLTPELVGAR
jgi:hypothetical protein